MPCYTVRLVSVVFKSQNETVLQSAAALLKWNYQRAGNTVYIGPVTVYLDRERAEARSQDDINALKRAYSQAAVKKAAALKGWSLNTWKKTSAGDLTTIATKY